MQKKLYNRLLKERMRERDKKISDEINYIDLIYYFKGSSSLVKVTEYEDPSDNYDKKMVIKQYRQQKKSKKKKIKSKLGEITLGNPEHKSDDQLDTIQNVQNLYNSRQKIINWFNDNAKIRSEAIYKSKQNETTEAGLKILTTKQMLQRLLIAFAQVKAGNNSESLLN